MEESRLGVENILHDLEADRRYRVICMSGDDIFVCEMDVTRLNIFAFSYTVLLDWIDNGTFRVEEDDPIIVDSKKLPEGERIKYEDKLNMMREIGDTYGPTYIGLMGKKAKPEVKAVLDKYGIDKSTLWRNILKYLQSGLRLSSLVDGRAKSPNKGREHNFTVKTGRKPKDFPNEGYLVTEEDHKHFDEALKWYASGKCKTKRAAFLKMSKRYYYQEVNVNGKNTRILKPEWERPTLTQFYDYAKKVISAEQNEIIKTSAQEVRNSKRLKIGDVRHDAYGPGYRVEVDEWEGHQYVVSGTKRDHTIGKPIVHLMVDEYSHLILAYSVSPFNNSVLGVTTLLKNLGEDKLRFCEKRGVYMDRETIDSLWPSNVLPKIIRVDRGAEYISKDFTRICKELNIEKQNVSGGSGSLKGVVEHIFDEIDIQLAPFLEGSGQIKKQHGSKHREEAVLTIEEYDTILLNVILAHNEHCNNSFRMDPDMLDNGIPDEDIDFNAMPSLIWKQGIEKYGPPRPITDKTHFAYTLMTDAKATVSNRGICVEGLWYLADDPELLEEMRKAGTKRIPFEARMDERTVDAVYYLRDLHLVRAPLNAGRSGNIEFEGMTWDDYRKYKKEIDAKRREGERHNQQIDANVGEVIENIVANAQREIYSSTENMRENWNEEKQRFAASNRLETLLNDPEGPASLSELETAAQKADDVPAATSAPQADNTPTPELPDAKGPTNADAEHETEEPVHYKDLKDAMRRYRNR